MDFKAYLEYLKNEKGMAENTLKAYYLDLLAFEKELNEKGIYDINGINNTEIVAYILKLKNQGKSASTSNRKIASIRMYYNYLSKIGVISENPTDNIKVPKVAKKSIAYLEMAEMNRIFEATDETPKGIRDKAILELIYATGIRASEVVETRLTDVNLRMGFVMCSGPQARARVVPFGRHAREALGKYISEARPALLKEAHDDEYLFLNRSGQRLSRQGLWKIMGEYTEKCGLEQKLTPQLLRNSFAVHMLQNGADIKAMQEMLGHEDLATTQAYLAVTKSKIKDVYDRAHPRK